MIGSHILAGKVHFLFSSILLQAQIIKSALKCYIITQDIFSNFTLSEALPLLVQVIQSADAKTKENINATENCISAVGKIMKFKPDCINVEEVLPHWLSWLPLHEDKEEAVHTFNYLCDLIER